MVVDGFGAEFRLWRRIVWRGRGKRAPGSGLSQEVDPTEDPTRTPPVNSSRITATDSARGRRQEAILPLLISPPARKCGPTLLPRGALAWLACTLYNLLIVNFF